MRDGAVDGDQARARTGSSRGAPGTLSPKPTGVVRGAARRARVPLRRLQGVPLPGVPFHESWGVILNDKGRVLDPETKQPVVGEYTAGWIKRGPTGVIGTNKPDALETVECMMDDLAAGHTWYRPSRGPGEPSA